MKIAIVNCFETYEIRVNQVETYFKNKGHSIDKFFSDYSHRNKKKVMQKKDDSTVYIKVPKYKKNLSFSRLYSHYVFSKKANTMLKEKEYDLIYVLVPPNSLLKFIFQNASLKNVCVDVIDIWPEAIPLNLFKNLCFFKKWRQYRDNYIDKANFLITECNLFKDELLRHDKELNISTVYFYGGEKQYVDYVPFSKKNLTFCYIGSINNLLDIDLLCNFFMKLNYDWNINLQVIGSGERLDTLISKVEAIGVKVTSYGTIYSDADKNKIIRNCNFGINLMKDSTKVGLTMKSIEYMRFGLPIINNIPSDTWEFVDKSKVGLNITKASLKEDILFFNDLNEKEMMTIRSNTYSTYTKLFSYDSFNNSMDKIFFEFNEE